MPMRSMAEWTQTQSDDPIAVAALVALAEARTERTAAILLDQYHGALRRRSMKSGRTSIEATGPRRGNASMPCWPTKDSAGI